MPTGNAPAGASEWRQHWTMLLPSVAGVMLCSIHGYSLGVMIGPLEREFGWTRAEISTGPLIISIIALLAAPLVGIAVDRLGPRRIAMFGILFFCTAFALISTATANIASWWGLWTILGLAAMMVLPAIWTAAISSLFIRNRGMALAIALCGTSLSASFIPSLTNFLVDGHGWRGAYVGLALVNATIVFPLAWIFFRSARDNHRMSGAGLTLKLPLLSGVSAREGFASARFLKLSAATVIFSIAINGLTTNAVPILISQGIGPAGAAGIAGLMGLGSLLGRLGGGYLLDRIDARKVAAVSSLAPGISVGLLLAMPGSTEVAMAAAFILGLGIGTELDACAYLAGRHFGLRSFGTLFGAINGMMLFANGLAPMLANMVYDATRSYTIFLWAVLPGFLITALLFILLGAYPTFETEGSEQDATAA